MQQLQLPRNESRIVRIPRPGTDIHHIQTLIHQIPHRDQLVQHHLRRGRLRGEAERIGWQARGRRQRAQEEVDVALDDASAHAGDEAFYRFRFWRGDYQGRAGGLRGEEGEGFLEAGFKGEESLLEGGEMPLKFVGLGWRGGLGWEIGGENGTVRWSGDGVNYQGGLFGFDQLIFGEWRVDGR